MKRYTLIAWDDNDDEERQLVMYVYDPAEEYGELYDADVTDIITKPTPTSIKLLLRLSEES